jgi:hypothetical protein
VIWLLPPEARRNPQDAFIRHGSPLLLPVNPLLYRQRRIISTAWPESE